MHIVLVLFLRGALLLGYLILVFLGAAQPFDGSPPAGKTCFLYKDMYNRVMIICQQTGKCVDCDRVGKGYLVEKATPTNSGFERGILCQYCAVDYLAIEAEALVEQERPNDD